MKKSIVVAFSLMALVSCENGVRFETPQPEGQRDELSIPTKMIGLYRSASDSTLLKVTNGLIIKIADADFSGSISELDSAERATVKHDTAFTQTSGNMDFDIVIKGDSIFQHMHYRDTLFRFSKNNILRKFKGYYFLNNGTEPGRWNVMKVSLTKNTLILGTISNKEDIENLRELTNVNSDTVYTFKPTRRQMRHFIRDKSFQNEERFVKISIKRLASSPNLSGQAFLLSNLLAENICEVEASCDCCATDLVFLTNKTFAMINRCLYNDSYYVGTYGTKESKLSLNFKQMFINDIFDETTNKSRLVKKKAKIEPMEFDMFSCGGSDKIRLENGTIKELKFGSRRPIAAEKETIAELRGSKQWKMISD